MEEKDAQGKEQVVPPRIMELLNQSDPVINQSALVEQPFTKNKYSPIKDNESSSYAKPTLSNKFKTIRKTVNNLAKYRPTQEVPGVSWNQKGNKNKKIRMSMGLKLLQPFWALSKASMSNAEIFTKRLRGIFSSLLFFL